MKIYNLNSDHILTLKGLYIGCLVAFQNFTMPANVLLIHYMKHILDIHNVY